MPQKSVLKQAADVLHKYQALREVGVIGVNCNWIQVEPAHFTTFAPDPSTWVLVWRNSTYCDYEARFYFAPQEYVVALLDEVDLERMFGSTYKLQAVPYS